MTSAPTPAQIAAAANRPIVHQRVFDGVEPHRYDLRLGHHPNGDHTWALSTPTGIVSGQAEDVLALCMQVLAVTDELAPDGPLVGVALHARWPLALDHLRTDVELFIRLSAPHARLMRPRVHPQAQALWALMGVYLRRAYAPPLLPAPKHPAKAAPALHVATDASIGAGHAGWAYVTHEGKYKADSGRGPRKSEANDKRDNSRVEKRAVRMALDDLAPIARERKVIIWTDSMDAVREIGSWASRHEKYRNVTIRWTRGHVGHVLNDAADRISRLARISGVDTMNRDLAQQIATAASDAWRDGVRVDPQLASEHVLTRVVA